MEENERDVRGGTNEIYKRERERARKKVPEETQDTTGEANGRNPK